MRKVILLTWLLDDVAIIAPVKRLLLAALICVLLLAACSADQPQPLVPTVSPTTQGIALADEPATATPLPATGPPASATPLPSAEPVDEPTASAEPATPKAQPSPTSEPEPLQIISGQTAEGAFFLGAPDAPVTVIDYSDFL